MKQWIGRWLMVVAVIHIVAAVAIYHRIFGLIGERGVFNTVAGDPVIGAFVWSLFFGCVAFCGGLAVDAVEKSSGAIPKTLGWILIVIALVGIVLVPVSGFWLVFPPAVGILLRK